VSGTREQHVTHGTGVSLCGGKPTETEVTLLLAADAPEQIADEVAALTELDAYALLHAPDQEIRDRYFDTPDRSPAAAGATLRLRELEARTPLTIKSAPRAAARVGVTRDEQEEPWPGRAWALLRAELGETLAVPALPPASDPVRALEAIGLMLVQTRSTSRRVRAVLPRSGARARLAELAIDAVVFQLGAGTVRHHELELEAEAEGADDVLAALARSRLRRFAPGVRPWSLGKLATGSALARLIEQRGAEAVLTADGRVRPAAYDAIEEAA